MLISCIAYEQGSKLSDIDAHDAGHRVRKAGWFVRAARQAPSSGEGAIQGKHSTVAIEEYRKTRRLVARSGVSAVADRLAGIQVRPFKHMPGLETARGRAMLAAGRSPLHGRSCQLSPF